jgi:PhnB protein
MAQNHTPASITPYIIVKDAAKAIQFYTEAFHAKVLERHDTEDKRVMHARLQIGGSELMISDEFPEPQSCGLRAPASSQHSSSLIHLYTDNVDAAFAKALECGAKTLMPVEDMFWGDRYGQLEDPFGHRWSLATPLKK